MTTPAATVTEGSPTEAAKQQVDPRAGLTHAQRTDPRRLYAEYQKYFDEDRERRYGSMTGWQRLTECWDHMWAGMDSFEGRAVHDVLVFGSMTGFMYGAVNDTFHQVKEYQKQHDEFVFAGLLKEKWLLTKTTMLRATFNGIRMSVIFCLAPLAMTTALLSSAAYRNNVNPVDFGVITAATSALYDCKKGASVIMRRSGKAFCVGFGVACLIRAGFWLADSNYAHFRYWAVYRRYRSTEMLSKSSWDKYKDMPEHKMLHERAITLQADMERYRQERIRRKKNNEKVYDAPRSMPFPPDPSEVSK